MTQKKITNPATIARRLTGGKPLAYNLRADGTLVVIDAHGVKHCFTPTQVRKTAAETKAEGA